MYLLCKTDFHNGQIRVRLSGKKKETKKKTFQSLPFNKLAIRKCLNKSILYIQIFVITDYVHHMQLGIFSEESQN